MNTNRFAIASKDSEVIGDFVTTVKGHEVMEFHSIDQIRHDDYDLILIDFQLIEDPETAQFLLSKIRKKIHEITVLLILRVNVLEDVQHDWFFNDFIVYPFRKGELWSRINRLMWGKASEEESVSLGNITINLNEYTVFIDNSKVDLTYKEFELLKLFVLNRGTVFSRKDILGKIWGVEYIGGTRTVDVHIRRLRSKMGDAFNNYLETVRNVGYKCREED